MPPRSIVTAILGFWLAANGWLVYREVWPYWRPGEPPPYTIDLTEELGSSSVDWQILKNDRPIGNAIAHIERQRGRIYRLRTEYHFDKLRLSKLAIRQLTTTYYVNPEGDLLGLGTKARIAFLHGKLPDTETEIAMEAWVHDGMLEPRLMLDKMPLGWLGDAKVPIERRGGVINPLHPLNRLPGLTVGRHWRIALFDPIGALGEAMGSQFQEAFDLLKGLTVHELFADVKADTLAWDGAEVACFKIEYRKPGAPDLVAATWVRRRDGLVLQQFSRDALTELTLRRTPR